MADFMSKTPKEATEAGSAKGSLARDNTEHEAPPVMHLEAHHIHKLFGGKMPPIGSKIKVHGLVHVGAFNEGSAGPPSGGKAKGGEGHTPRTMTLHFHKMDMGQEGISGGEKEESQKAGMKAEIDRVLTKGEGSESEGKAER
jgi:hypothetical protein